MITYYYNGTSISSETISCYITANTDINTYSGGSGVTSLLIGYVSSETSHANNASYSNDAWGNNNPSSSYTIPTINTDSGAGTETTLKLLPDQEVTSSTFYITTKFELYHNTTKIDECGSSDHNGTYFTHNIILGKALKYDSGNRNTVNSYVRNSGTTPPSTTYDEDDWYISSNTVHQFGAAGDPHICTLFGEHYEFDHLGAIRLFDNQHARSGKDNDLIIINGLVEPGPGRWAKNQYIQKLFVYNAGKTMVVNLGFRGSKVVVEHNDGIPYEEEELGFHDDALMHAFEGMASFKDPEKAKEYAELHGVLVPPLVRNQLTFELCGSEEDTAAHKVELTVTLSNVNKYNLQPCRINIDTGNDFNKKLATGCLMHRNCLLYTSPSPRDATLSRIPSSA